MKKVLFVTLVGLFTGSLLLFAQDVKTIKGEVVDLSCYTLAGAKGMGHQQCGLACIKGGEPAGILEDKTNKVYVVVTSDHSNPADKVIPYVAKKVTAKGKVFSRGGIKVIDLDKISEISGK